MVNDKKLIPFDLERAKKGDEVVTRDGRAVRIICFDANEKDYPIVALVSYANMEHVISYRKDGGYAVNLKESILDLFMKPKHHIAYINILKQKDGFMYPVMFKDYTKEQNDTYIRCVKEEEVVGTTTFEWDE